jgi:hypothetical protein
MCSEPYRSTGLFFDCIIEKLYAQIDRIFGVSYYIQAKGID